MRSEGKYCKNCKHCDKLAEEEPCNVCPEMFDLQWEPKEGTESE